MANAEELIPFILHFETGVPVKYLSLPCGQIFEQARKRGFACDPDDRGGATMCGVTLATYTEYRRGLGIKSTTADDLRAIEYGDWMKIFRNLFWDRWKADGIRSQPVANTLVDWVWMSGANGIKIPQRILGVKQDGIVGPKTLAALNGRDPKTFFSALQEERRKFIESIVRKRPANAKFRKGWLRRINALTFDGFQL